MSCSGPAFFIYFISGMWCTTCSKTVCSRVLKLAGVGGAEINFTTKLLTVEVDSAEPEALDGKIRMAVTQMGFGIKRQPDGWVQSFRQDLEQEHTRAISPGLFSIVAFLAMWSSMLSFSAYLGGLEQSEAYLLACLSTAMGTPAILIGCLPFVRAGLRALGGSRLITLDLFIGLGALSAVSLSLHNLAAGSSQTYVDSAAMILLVLLLAKILEARLSSYLAGQLLTQMEYGQDRVMVYSQDRWIQREAAAIRRRDRVRFEAGETVIFDGCLESPKALINSHLLNGEASDLPLERGAALFAGSIARSELELLVSQPLGSRMLDGWAESALLSKGRPHRYSGLLLTLERALTLVALAGASCLAASQWVQSGDLRLAAEAFAIGILIFCPCLFASILPLSKQMAHLALSRRGIIISRSEALLDLSGVDQIYLDKTGTLEAVDSFFRSSCASTETRARQLLASLARFSQHPVLLGLADLRAGLAPASVELEVVTTPGQGVRAEDPMGGDVLCVGRPAFVYRQVGLNPPAVQSHYPQVALNGRLVGHLITRQSFNAVAMECLQELFQLFPRVKQLQILSGDPAEGAGDALCARWPQKILYRGNLSPHDKAALIQGCSLFVGDGLNDTLAFARASVSCRLGRTNSLASADFCLMDGDLRGLISCIRYARQYRRVLCQTAWLAFSYNFIALWLAATGHFSPSGAVLAMLTSLLLLTASALRLLAFPPTT